MEPDPEDVKKKLEAIAGRELVVAPEHLNKLRFPASAYDRAYGAVAWQYLFLPGMSCEEAALLDVSGRLVFRGRWETSGPAQRYCVPRGGIGGARQRACYRSFRKTVFRNQHALSAQSEQPYRHRNHVLRLGRQGACGTQCLL